MRTLKMFALVGACTACFAASAACFTVLSKDGKTIHQASTTPVDLSLPLRETVPARFGPGASMVFSMDTLATDCNPVGVRKEAEAARGNDVMTTVFANVDQLRRSGPNAQVPAMTYPNPGLASKAGTRY